MGREERLRKLPVAGERSAPSALSAPAKPLPGQLGILEFGVRDIPGRGGLSPRQQLIRRAQGLACRKCKAGDGEPCKTLKGKTRQPHQERLSDAEKAS